MSPPDLNDPEQRAAYRRELRGVARGWLYATMAFWAASLAFWPWQAGTSGRTYGPPLILAGLACAVVRIVLRTRYHKARMRGAI